MYAELHCLSNFSFQRGASTAAELCVRAKELGYAALAITDECTMAGAVRAYEAAKDVGIHLILGSEFRFACGLKLLLLAADHEGYTAICGLITHARRNAEKGEYALTRADVPAAMSGVLAIWLPGEPPLVQEELPSDSRTVIGEGGRGQEPRSRADLGLVSGNRRGIACSEREAQPPPPAPRPCIDSLITCAAPQSDPLGPSPETLATGHWLAAHFAERWIGVALHRQHGDERRFAYAQALADALDIRLTAIGSAEMHVRGRRALHDVLAAIAAHSSVAEAGFHLASNGEQHLRSLQQLRALYPQALLDETLRIAARCRFSLAELRYQYPHEVVPGGCTATEHLRRLTEDGLRRRWPRGEPTSVRAQIEHELTLIADLKYESYFLTVHDIVEFARSRRILCQGRGSAANSAVCYALGITEVDPARGNLLFERFISRERNEPPDIDVDFEHERREEVIQYVYAKYGRDRAALTATVACYRPKSALRDVGKALGMSIDQVEEITGALTWWDGFGAVEERLIERGFDPSNAKIKKLLKLTADLLGFPRHLSQHVGGFVISERPLCELVPVENAAMPDRTIIQWDKDDLDTLGLLKVDCLALGMLSCLRRCIDLVASYKADAPLSLASIPAEDPATYAMLQTSDSVGVFQVESRAQMSMLPRLKPENYYDLVIEVAIVRPGPITGKMVHPYLRRRQGLEQVTYPSEDLKRVFERTLGIPIFQEQVMQLAIVAAGFTPGEADQLRRSMAAWKRRGGLEHYRQRIIAGMAERGYETSFAEQVFEQIKGFGSYGFPESHAASFALLVYASAWFKCHHPAAFAVALINSQPMGFYSVDQIVQDVRRHGVEVRPIDVRFSNWDASLEHEREIAIRLGLREIQGFRIDSAQRLLAARSERTFSSVQDLATRAELERSELEILSHAGALRGLAGHRHRAQWAVTGIEKMPELLASTQIKEERAQLRLPTPAENTLADYQSTQLTLVDHPLKLLRGKLKSMRMRRVDEAMAASHGTRMRVAGLVKLRQRPGTASGVMFVTLEDESGWLNLIIWRDLADRERRVVLESQLLGVTGELQKAEGVTHLLAKRLDNLTHLLEGTVIRSRDFH